MSAKLEAALHIIATHRAAELASALNPRTEDDPFDADLIAAIRWDAVALHHLLRGNEAGMVEAYRAGDEIRKARRERRRA
jgi:hypothetical protein